MKAKKTVVVLVVAITAILFCVALTDMNLISTPRLVIRFKGKPASNVTLILPDGLMNGKDIQELIPETHRDLVEAVPRGSAKSAVTGALLMGAAGGALLAMFVPEWVAAGVFTTLYLGHRIQVAASDRGYNQNIAELEARDLEWKDDHSR